MSKPSPLSPSPSFVASNYVFDEDQWLGVMQDTFSRGLKGKDEGIAASVFEVPKSLHEAKPEAYTPQVFAIGPCHKRQPELNNTEKSKAAYAREAEKALQYFKFEELVKHFVGLERRIRAEYERYLDFKPQTLAWMMAIDACFLLEFFWKRSHEEGKSLGNLSSDMAWMNKALVRDLLVLENQIPLFLLAEVLKLARVSEQDANAEISSLLTKFIKDVSPFRTAGGSPAPPAAHLLGLLYQAVAPKWDGSTASTQLTIEYEGPEAEVIEAKDVSKVQQAWGIVQKWLPRGLRDSTAAKFLGDPSVRKAADLSIKKLFPDSKPSVNKIRIPSAAELVRVGVKLVAADPNGIEGVRFDADTLELRLPAITMDDGTEVIMRNLIAYEATAVPEQLIFARSTEMMKGIIDTEEDVELLVERGIIRGRLSSSKALDVLEGMGKSIRATHVPRLDEVIVSVNRYYDNVWIVKAQRVLKKRVYDSWKLLTFLAAALLLLMTALQTFCAAYTCSRWFGKLGFQKQ